MDQTQSEALMPTPDKVVAGGHELIVRPIPVKKLLHVLKYVEDNMDAMQKMGSGAGFADGLRPTELMTAEVYPRLNEIVRRFVPEHAQLLTDDWCAEHLSNAHYWALIRAGLRQNKLEEVFRKLGGAVWKNVEAALQQLKTGPSA